MDRGPWQGSSMGSQKAGHDSLTEQKNKNKGQWRWSRYEYSVRYKERSQSLENKQNSIKCLGEGWNQLMALRNKVNNEIIFLKRTIFLICMNLLQYFFCFLFCFRDETGYCMELNHPLYENINLKILVSVQFSRSVMSDSLRPHESQQARPPCPSPTHCRWWLKTWN